MTRPTRRYRLEFHGGSRDGEVLLLDEPPDQEGFVDDGYWVEDIIVNDRLAAVPLHRLIPNGRHLWSESVGEDDQ